jgi:hypothetical protein
VGGWQTNTQQGMYLSFGSGFGTGGGPYLTGGSFTDFAGFSGRSTGLCTAGNGDNSSLGYCNLDNPLGNIQSVIFGFNVVESPMLSVNVVNNNTTILFAWPRETCSAWALAKIGLCHP